MAYKEWTITSYITYNAYITGRSNELPEEGYPDNDAYLAIRNQAVGDFIVINPTINPWLIAGQSNTHRGSAETYRYYVRRAVFYFRNSGSIMESAPIEYAKLEVYKLAQIGEINFTVVITNGQPTYPHAPPVVADYDITHYSGNGGQLVNPTGYGWKEIVLNEAGRGFIDITADYVAKLCLVTQDDIDSTPPLSQYDDGFQYIKIDKSLRAKLTIRVTLSSPTAQTDEETEQGESSAVFNGEITHSGYWLDSYGFEWKQGEDGEIQTIEVGTNKTQGLVYNYEKTGLSGTIYYRAYGTNEAGTGYGEWEEIVFEVAEVTTEAASSVGVDHAKGNGTANAESTERGFEVKLAFSGTLKEAISRMIAGFEGDLTWDIVNKWNGDLVKTVTEEGTFVAESFVDDLGRFPIAVASDKLFAAETYDYRAYAIIGGETYYGDWVEFTTAGYPAGEGPDDIISPEIPIIEPIPPDEPILPDLPDIIWPPWVFPEIDIPPFESDPGITFGKTFGAFLRGMDTKKDWRTLREKCIIYQENMNEFVLTVNHNSLVIKNLVIDVITYIDGDVYPSDLELVASSQQLTPLYLEEISPIGFKDIINDFRLKDVCNVHTLNLNFKKILSSLNSLYESDYVTEPISYNAIEYIDIQPTAKRMILQLEDMRKKYGEVRRLTIRNMRRIFTYV